MTGPRKRLGLRPAIAMAAVALVAGLAIAYGVRLVSRPSPKAPIAASKPPSPTPTATLTACTSSAPPPRMAAAMTYDGARKTIVLFSGIRGDGSAPLADTWTWDGCRWQQASPATSPPGRSLGAMAFDPRSGRVVLFGGGSPNSDPLRNDTWTWDGSTWRQEHPSTSPPLMDQPLMVYDAGNQNIVLVGSLLQGDVGATWTWDGSTWRPHPSTSPPRRANSGLAFAARSGVLLFGGQPGEAGALNDTWVWDGSTWSQLHPATTPEGGATIMVHEDSRHDVLMVEHDGTWTWNGSNWSHLHPASVPPFQLFRSMAYDAARDRVVLFGGKSPPNQPTNDTWLWDGSTWSRIAG